MQTLLELVAYWFLQFNINVIRLYVKKSRQTFDNFLVLYQDNNWRDAMIINAAGEKRVLSCFDKGNRTNLLGSCSITWQNQLHIFGGKSDLRQISRLDGYRLNNIGALPQDFKFYDGACTQMNGQFIFLCFGHYETYVCRRFTEPRDSKPYKTTSHKSHSLIQISASKCKFCRLNSAVYSI